MPKEFVDKIRQKYPGAYDDLSDQELAQKVLAKHPQYQDVLGDMVAPPKAETPEGPPPQQTGIQQLMDVLKPAKDYAMGAREMQGNGEWFSGSGGKDRLAAQLTPSLPTTLSLTLPAKGMGVGAEAGRATSGVLPALRNIGLVTGASAGQNAIEGKDPTTGGLVGGISQTAQEALPGMVKPAARLAGDLVPGAAARAIRGQTRLLEGLRSPAPVPEGVPWGKALPTGIPGSKVLDQFGKPMEAAIDPVMVPSKSLKGWTYGDVVEPMAAKAAPTTPQGWNGLQSLMRLMGAGAQEGYERGGM